MENLWQYSFLAWIIKSKKKNKQNFFLKNNDHFNKLPKLVFSHFFLKKKKHKIFLFFFCEFIEKKIKFLIFFIFFFQKIKQPQFLKHQKKIPKKSYFFFFFFLFFYFFFFFFSSGKYEENNNENNNEENNNNNPKKRGRKPLKKTLEKRVQEENEKLFKQKELEEIQKKMKDVEVLLEEKTEIAKSLLDDCAHWEKTANSFKEKLSSISKELENLKKSEIEERKLYEEHCRDLLDEITELKEKKQSLVHEQAKAMSALKLGNNWQ